MQISWSETCDCPARRMSAPLILENIKATDTRLQETKHQDLKEQDSKSEDDKAEKDNASDLDSVDRFDAQNLSSTLNGCNFWDNQSTNAQQGNCE